MDTITQATKKKVLIVDDQSFIRQVLEEQLKGFEGVELEIMEAANGNEAIGKTRVGKPDLILLDIVMEGKNGLQVMEELRNDPETFNIPVVVISSHAELEKQAEYKQLGAVAFINKMELKKDDFLAVVRKALSL